MKTHNESYSLIDSKGRISRTLIRDENEVIKKGRIGCVPHKQGIAVVVLAYILFAYLYGITLVYGIWHFKFADDHSDRHEVHAVINTILFSIFFLLMLVSHIQVVFTNPGEMPKDYEKLKEEELPHQFYELIRERESIYHELIVKKKVRKGELSLEGTGGDRRTEGSFGGETVRTVGSLNRSPPTNE